MLDNIYPLLTRISRKLTFLPRGRIGVFLNNFLTNQKIIRFQANNGLHYISDLRSYTENYVPWTGEYEGKTMDMVLPFVDSNSDILDIGANVGYWTINLAQKLNSASKLFAFEPIPSNFYRVKEHLRINNLQDKVEVFNFALGDLEGNISYFINQTDLDNQAQTFNATLNPNSRDSQSNKIVPIKTLDSILEKYQINNIGFVKIDVEGFELKVFAGASEFLKRNQPIIYGEFTPETFRENGDDPAKIFQIFQDYLVFQEKKDHFLEIKDSNYERDLLLIPKAKINQFKGAKTLKFLS